MAKIVIAGVNQGVDRYTVHVVLTEQKEVEGKKEDVPIGEAFVPFTNGTKAGKEKLAILKAAEGIKQRSGEAAKKRVALEKIDYGEIKL